MTGDSAGAAAAAAEPAADRADADGGGTTSSRDVNEVRAQLLRRLTHGLSGDTIGADANEDGEQPGSGWLAHTFTHAAIFIGHLERCAHESTAARWVENGKKNTGNFSREAVTPKPPSWREKFTFYWNGLFRNRVNKCMCALHIVASAGRWATHMTR
eukprot:COSAG01_NODE_453_length_16866_cov_30.622175_5_plen_157_part_00